MKYNERLDIPVYEVAKQQYGIRKGPPETLTAIAAVSLILNLAFKLCHIPFQTHSWLISPRLPTVQIKTKWTLIKIYVHTLDLVTWAKLKFAHSHISFSFLGMRSFIQLWYVLKMGVRKKKGNYLSGKLQFCVGFDQFSGIEDGDLELFICQTWLLPLSGPLFKSPSF